MPKLVKIEHEPDIQPEKKEKKPTIEELYGAYSKRPCPETMTPLMSSLEPTISKAIQTYGYLGDPNIRSSARLHVAKVIPRFDPKKAQLPTFVFNELQRLQRIGARQANVVPIPEQAILDLKNIDEIANQLEYKLGRPPTADELSDKTGLSSKRIGYIQNKYTQPMVTDTSIATEEGTPFSVATHHTDTDALWNELVYGELDPIDKKIMDWSLGMHGQGKRSKTSIAHELRISPAAITQRAQRIAKKLTESKQYTAFGNY